MENKSPEYYQYSMESSSKDVFSQESQSSNMSLSSPRRNTIPKRESILPEGYSWDAQFSNGVINDGVVSILDEDGCLYRKIQYKNGKRNGLCLYYHSGSLIEKRTFKDDVEEGWACHVCKGKEIKWFLYSCGTVVAELVKSYTLDGFWNAVDMTSHHILSCCQYDENHRAFDKGYLFNNGKIDKVVLFEKGEIVEVLKEFKNDVMIEYDGNNMKVYEGKYNVSNDYSRDGEGKEYENGIIVYIGNWKNSIREGYGKSLKNGMVEYEGDWKDGKPDGEGVYMQEDEVVYEGKWERGRYLIENGKWFDYESRKIVKHMHRVATRCEIQSYAEFVRILNNKMMTFVELVILEGCCNRMIDYLEISGFNNLSTIIVKKNSFNNVKSINITNLPKLQSFVTEGVWNSIKQTAESTFFKCEVVKIQSKLTVELIDLTFLNLFPLLPATIHFSKQRI